MTTDDIILYMDEQDKFQDIVDEYSEAIAQEIMVLQKEYYTFMLLTIEGEKVINTLISIDKFTDESEEHDHFKFVEQINKEEEELIYEYIFKYSDKKLEKTEDNINKIMVENDLYIRDILIDIVEEEPNRISKSISGIVPADVLLNMSKEYDATRKIVYNCEGEVLKKLIHKVILPKVTEESENPLELFLVTYKTFTDEIEKSYKDEHGVELTDEHIKNNLSQFMNHIFKEHYPEMNAVIGSNYSHLYRQYIRNF